LPLPQKNELIVFLAGITMFAPHQPEREISAFSFFRSHIYSQHLFKWKAFEQKKRKKEKKRNVEEQVEQHQEEANMSVRSARKNK